MTNVVLEEELTGFSVTELHWLLANLPTDYNDFIITVKGPFYSNSTSLGNSYTVDLVKKEIILGTL